MSPPQISPTNGVPLKNTLFQIDPKTLVWFEVTTDDVPRQANTLNIQTYDEMVTLLTTQGNEIKSLTIVFTGLSTEEAVHITQLIETHSSFSLLELMLVNVADVDYLISGAKRQFGHVKKLTIIRGSYVDNLRLNEIYPYVEKLYISLPKTAPISTLNRRYAELQKITFLTWNEDNTNVVPLIKLNSKINSLVLDRMPSLPTLQTISDTLEKLESFEIQCYLDKCIREFEHDGNVIFKSVKKFTLDMGSIGEHAPERIPITFDHLEALRIHTDTLEQVVVDYIKANDQLYSLALPSTVSAFEISYLADIIKELPPVKQIELSWQPNWRESDVQRLMMNARALAIIKLKVADKTLRGDIDAALPNRWRIVFEKNIPNTKAVEFDIRKSAHDTKA